ncbi:flavodoxin [Sporosarcina thermotolerans]|uniref:Flavodoxin n=1 Tax=Sporosarcina thermotolerans TaxID=633404 RepID=A0AAW9AB25_9BACL|nr:flavodoxin [Sporosarcina thermotolerans]MDW0118846.1 flavodoxin [Sporosarcina thermotolerans]WHT48456.1 flavodoxin [Sporosarcina thermotolerans]
MVSFLIAYASWSGNTEEVAEIVEETLLSEGLDVTVHRIGNGPIPNPRQFDAMIIGSFTWDKGATPDKVKDFVADISYKPENVYVFGTGDTQFGGDELFCHAADKLKRFYESKYEPLKIEQSPRGIQEKKVIEWAKGVHQHWQHLHALKC